MQNWFLSYCRSVLCSTPVEDSRHDLLLSDSRASASRLCKCLQSLTSQSRQPSSSESHASWYTCCNEVIIHTHFNTCLTKCTIAHATKTCTRQSRNSKEDTNLNAFIRRENCKCQYIRKTAKRQLLYDKPKKAEEEEIIIAEKTHRLITAENISVTTTASSKLRIISLKFLQKL